MITFDDIAKLFAIDLQNSASIEIEFRVIGFEDYQNCWMGKMPNNDKPVSQLYWFGLAEDGSKAYDYNDFLAFAAAPVFDGKSLKEVWNRIEIVSIDGCDPKWRLHTLLGTL